MLVMDPLAGNAFSGAFVAAKAAENPTGNHLAPPLFAIALVLAVDRTCDDRVIGLAFCASQACDGVAAPAHRSRANAAIKKRCIIILTLTVRMAAVPKIRVGVGVAVAAHQEKGEKPEPHQVCLDHSEQEPLVMFPDPGITCIPWTGELPVK